jgi:hypothetical protein
MVADDIEILAAERAERLVEMAEQARLRLSEFADHEVDYDATALQLLDEWVERVVQRTPQPDRGMRVLWIAFLGEVFRLQFEGEWALKEGNGKALVMLCPAAGGGFHAIEVAQQVQRRISGGFQNSLTLFHAQESIALKRP